MWNHLWIIRLIKSLLPLQVKIILIRILVIMQKINSRIFSKELKYKSENNKIYVLLSTDYSNLGDHAMTYAHIKMLEENFPDFEIVEVLVGDTLKYIRYIEKNIKKDDVITLKGGGNIGLEYFREELYRRYILEKFKENKIILFPQTVYFPKTKLGDKEFLNTMSIFNAHPKFYAFIRDKVSFDKINDYIKDRKFLVPDIALSLKNFKVNDFSKKGACICMRRDVEGIYSEDDKKIIYSLSKEYYGEITITDTITEYLIPITERENELYKMWNLFNKSELVVTDRLHGMIFAALLGVPCIVFKTYNHKLIGQYEWLKCLEYIKLIECKKDAIENTMKILKETEVNKYTYSTYRDKHNLIIKAIKGDAIYG